MQEEDKNIENKIEEANYQLRVEIAERCINQDASIDFVAKVCLFTQEEVIIIYRSLKRRNYLLDKQDRDNKIQETYKKTTRQKLKEKKLLKEEKKHLELEQKNNKKEERQRKADFQREIAAENTRVLLQKIKDEQKSQIEQKQREKEAEIFARKEEKMVKISGKESLDASNELSKEQKMIASVGQCYLRGLNAEQAVLFSKASPEQVERIYNSFKNK